ncbi:MAG: UDP-N-acetylglucosamine 2-epimerase (non-hydrolyzing) [Smithellaceae bacterium]|nr:UDP-N-acetylglucosamine 2-epimerase (non-hydrolyzing) [Smithellaceae bacterium]
MKILLVAGARPNFMKIAPIARSLSKRAEISWQLVHTGQHYDHEMSKAFFDELGIKEPDFFLNAGSGTHAEQTARVMIEFEKICVTERPDLTMVVGDVNSTLACSVTAKKLNIQVAHVEAGLRSRDMTMPEEINRIVTDALSDYLFVSEKSGLHNLRSEGKNEENIFFVGNVMIDTLYYQLAKIEEHPDAYPKPAVVPSGGNYAVVTLHRPANVDDEEILQGIISALVEIAEDMPVIFPAHPRTKKNMERFRLLNKIAGKAISLLPPLPYMAFLTVWKEAALVLTDSGGLQEETTALGIPCFTLRDNTERPITIEEGTNRLVGIRPDGIRAAYDNFRNGQNKKGRIPELWDGMAAERIVDIILK